MEHKYLTFRLHSLRYGIDATLVQEVFSLPELIPIGGGNTDVIGIFNFRKQIVPVIHLDLLYGYPVFGLYLSDYIIVFQCSGMQIGMVVHQVDEMLEVETQAIETVTYSGLECDISTSFIAGVTKVESDTILLLDSEKLVRQPETLLTLIWDVESQLDFMAASDDGQHNSKIYQELEGIQIPSFYDLYCPNATKDEREIFRQRAFDLLKILEDMDLTPKLMPLAVISFGKEYFGLDLELVREFTDIYNLTPIPCCPKHIVGNMNLRGEIVTLVDIRNVLNLPFNPVKVGSRAVVVQVDDIVAGLPVDKVLDMVYLNPADMIPLSVVLPKAQKQYLRGIAPFQEGMLSVLDLPKIFTKGRLVVYEEV